MELKILVHQNFSTSFLKYSHVEGGEEADKLGGLCESIEGLMVSFVSFLFVLYFPASELKEPEVQKFQYTC